MKFSPKCGPKQFGNDIHHFWKFLLVSGLGKTLISPLPIHLFHSIYQWDQSLCSLFLRAKFRNWPMLFDETLIEMNTEILYKKYIMLTGINTFFSNFNTDSRISLCSGAQ